MPCSEPRNFSHISDYICDFCSLPDPDVVPSVLVCAVVHTSLRVGLCGRKFVLCLFGECPGLYTTRHKIFIAGSTQELYICPSRQV